MRSCWNNCQAQWHDEQQSATTEQLHHGELFLGSRVGLNVSVVRFQIRRPRPVHTAFFPLCRWPARYCYSVSTAQGIVRAVAALYMHVSGSAHIIVSIMHMHACARGPPPAGGLRTSVQGGAASLVSRSSNRFEAPRPVAVLAPRRERPGGACADGMACAHWSPSRRARRRTARSDRCGGARDVKFLASCRSCLCGRANQLDACWEIHLCITRRLSRSPVKRNLVSHDSGQGTARPARHLSPYQLPDFSICSSL